MALSDPGTPPEGTLPVRLEAIEYGARDINVYRFTPLQNAVLPPACPGAHIDVFLKNGLTRQYSLINSGERPAQYTIAVKKDPNGRGGSKALHDTSIVGSEYRISAPRNNFMLANDTADTVLLAGGIGITPLINMFHLCQAEGRPVKLFYWAMQPEDFLFSAELNANHDAQLFAAGLDENTPLLSDIMPSIPLDAHLYCCGPAGMLDEFERLGAGRPKHLLHQERFAALRPVEAPTNAYTVTLAKTNRKIDVGPGQSILHACLDANIDVSFSCEEGVCGACEVRVLAGKVMHKDSVRTAEEHNLAGTMMICCSNAAGGDLVLDI